MQLSIMLNAILLLVGIYHPIEIHIEAKFEDTGKCGVCPLFRKAPSDCDIRV